MQLRGSGIYNRNFHLNWEKTTKRKIIMFAIKWFTTKTKRQVSNCKPSVCGYECMNNWVTDDWLIGLEMKLKWIIKCCKKTCLNVLIEWNIVDNYTFFFIANTHTHIYTHPYKTN